MMSKNFFPRLVIFTVISTGFYFLTKFFENWLEVTLVFESMATTFGIIVFSLFSIRMLMRLNLITESFLLEKYVLGYLPIVVGIVFSYLQRFVLQETFWLEYILIGWIGLLTSHTIIAFITPNEYYQDMAL